MSKTVLVELSDALADAAELARRSTVLVNARRRVPASGIVFAPGLVLTAEHVVEKNEDITVVLADGTDVSATVAGRDAGTDLAVLKLERTAGTVAEVTKRPAHLGQIALALALHHMSNRESAVDRTRRAGTRVTVSCMVTALTFAAVAGAAEFGSRDGPVPANIEEISAVLRQDPYDLELLVSFGTSKGGSAGHLALAIRDQAGDDDLVYSANFYADREPEHARDFYIDDLMVRIPKKEYLFGTTSSVSDKASFGLDFGEVYKRSVVGVRVYGVPAGGKEALAAFFRRINDDFHKRARNTEYHDGEIKYDYLRLNCAKTIGSAFRYGVVPPSGSGGPTPP